MYIMYLRKSRADGEHETAADVLAKHYSILQEHARAQLGGDIPEHNIYREIVSGETIADRPEMLRVLELVQSGSVSGVLVVDPQRLSRGDLSDCGTIIRAFRYSNTAIITPSKVYDLTDKFDRKFFEMELLRGNDYLEYVKEIMLRGRLASVNAGNFIAPVAPYGYDKIKDGKSYTLTPNDEAPVVQMIFDMWTRDKLGSTTIATRLNQLHIKPRKSDIWNNATIRDILRNPVYCGRIRWNWNKQTKKFSDGELKTSRVKSDNDVICVPGRHPAIITLEQFEAATARFGTAPRVQARRELVNPLAGLLYCSCGRAMLYQPQRNCEPRLHCAKQMYCGNRSATYKEVETEIINALKRSAYNVQAILEGSAPTPSDTQNSVLNGLRKELRTVETQINRLFDFLEQGVYTAEIYTQRNAVLNKRRTELLDGIAELEQQKTVAIDYKRRCIQLQDAINILQTDSATAAEKNNLLKAIVKKIVYSRQTSTRDKWHNIPFTLDITLL